MAEFHNPFQLPTAIERQERARPALDAPYPQLGPAAEAMAHRVNIIAAPQQEKRKPGRPKKVAKVVKG